MGGWRPWMVGAVAAVAGGLPAVSWAQGRLEARRNQASLNEANNPLTPKLTFNVHNYYMPELAEMPADQDDANQFIMRGSLAHDLFGPEQFFRISLAVPSAPTATGDTTAIGDLTVFDLLFFEIQKLDLELGLGPLFVFPTAGEDATGTGKWQLGGAAATMNVKSWGIVGGLLTYQHSFAGDDYRDDVSLLTFQPVLFYNLPNAFYLRSSGIWNIDFDGAADYIPVGAGAGKVFSPGDLTINTFIEPQLSVWDNGQGVPHWQVFLGLNLQLPVWGG
jgi:hypothetical protein